MERKVLIVTSIYTVIDWISYLFSVILVAWSLSSVVIAGRVRELLGMGEVF